MRDTRALPHQVRDRVLELLKRGKYRPGDRIPSEQQLTNILEVSRPTLREGLRILEQERIIRARHGSGRFLLSIPGSIAVDITRLQSVTELLAGQGIRAKVRVLAVGEIRADERIAGALNIEAQAPLISIERIWYADQVPVIYSVDMIPTQLARTTWSPSDFKGSLLAFLENEWGIHIDHTQTTIHACALGKALAARIDAPPGTSWILLEQINLDTDGRPIIYSQDYHRGDAITYHVTRYRR